MSSKVSHSFVCFMTCFSVAGTVNSALLEELVVTAQKREQSMKDIPITISALTGETLEDLGLVSAKEIQNFTPGLVWAGTNDTGKPELFLRGVGFDDFQAATGSPVAMYQDGIAYGALFGASSQLFDFERVEVLKGPQGTLWGRNTTGGLIHFIPRKPEIGQETDGYIRLTGSEFDGFIGEAAVGGSLGEQTAGRFSIKHAKHGGYTKNDNPAGPSDLNGYDWTALRGQIMWQPTDSFSARLAVNHSDLSADGTVDKVLGGTPPAGGTCTNAFAIGTTCLDGIGNTTPTDLHTVTASTAGFEDVTNTMVGLHMEFDLGWASLTSVTGYQQSERDHFDEDGTGVNASILETMFFDEYDGWSQEIRLASQSDGKFNWILGGYYSTGDLESLRSFNLPIFAFARARFVETSTDVSAIFADGTYDLTDTVTVTAGVRLTHDERTFQFESLIVPAGFPSGTVVDGEFARANLPIPAVPVTNRKESWTESSWRAAVNWAINEDVSVFASISDGFRGGEVNAGATSVSGVTISEPEFLLAYEVGMKGRFLDKSLGANVSFFFYDYDDKILFVELPDPDGAGNVLQTFNGSKVEVTGLEVQLDWAPTDQLNLAFNATWTDGEYVEGGFTLPNGGDITGNTTENTPETSFSVIGRYNMPLSNDASLAFQVDYSWRDDFFFVAINDIHEFQSSYGLLGASIGYKPASDRWDASLWVKNLNDEQYLTDGFNFSGIHSFPGPPRVVGGTLSYRF